MIYLNEISLKKEMVLVNNANKLKKDSTLKEYNNLDLLNELQKKYETETYNIRKGQIEEEFNNEVQKCYIKDYSKETFGEMILMLIKNLLKKHCFSGYTQEWKEDFAIDAIDKILRYMHNFDPSKISERSGKRVKAFAYLTQITTQAFISVINKKNDEKHKSKNYDVISYSSMYSESFVNKLYHNDNQSRFTEPEIKYKEYYVKSLDEIIDILKDYNESNAIKITYPLEIKSIPLDVYAEIERVKPNIDVIIMRDYVPSEDLDTKKSCNSEVLDEDQW